MLLVNKGFKFASNRTPEVGEKKLSKMQVDLELMNPVHPKIQFNRHLIMENI